MPFSQLPPRQHLRVLAHFSSLLPLQSTKECQVRAVPLEFALLVLLVPVDLVQVHHGQVSLLHLTPLAAPPPPRTPRAPPPLTLHAPPPRGVLHRRQHLPLPCHPLLSKHPPGCFPPLQSLRPLLLLPPQPKED